MLDAVDAIDRALLPVLLRWHGPWLDAIMAGVAFLGSKALVWLLLAGAALLRPLTRAAAWRVLLTVALCYLVAGAVLKPLVARPRPPIAPTAAARDLPGIPTNCSFPSDRATAAAGAAVALSRIWPGVAPVWGALAILIGYSAIYIGHHYPTDVIGGYVLGVLLAWWALGGRHQRHLLPRCLARFQTDWSSGPERVPRLVKRRPRLRWCAQQPSTTCRRRRTADRECRRPIVSITCRRQAAARSALSCRVREASLARAEPSGLPRCAPGVTPATEEQVISMLP